MERTLRSGSPRPSALAALLDRVLRRGHARGEMDLSHRLVEHTQGNIALIRELAPALAHEPNRLRTYEIACTLHDRMRCVERR